MTTELNDKSIWDEIYRKTGNKPGWDKPGADYNLFELIVKHSDETMPLNILDVGCGNGRNAPLAEQLEEKIKKVVTYRGTDFSESALAYCKESYPHRDFILQDICQLSSDSELIQATPYNVIMDCGCFHAIPPEKRGDYAKTVKELIAPEGLYIIGAWYREENKEGTEPQYYPFLYLSEWFFNESDINRLWQEDFTLINCRVDKDIYPGMFDGFAYFVLKKR